MRMEQEMCPEREECQTCKRCLTCYGDILKRWFWVVQTTSDPDLLHCIELSIQNIVKRHLHVWIGVELNQHGLCNSASSEN